jgi:uncharacterized protein YutD
MLHDNFNKNKKDLEISNIWFYDRHNIDVIDGIYSGYLNIEDKYDFIVGVEFDNQKALKNYYEHKIHSKEREALYKTINPNIKDKYDELRKLKTKKGQQHIIREKYNILEKEMSNYILRMDLSVNDTIQSIINTEPIPFGSKIC